MTKWGAGQGTSVQGDPRQAVSEAVARAREGLSGQPSVAMLMATVDHDAAALWAAPRAEVGGAQIVGITSSLCVLGAGEVVSGPEGAVGVMLLEGVPGARVVAAHAALGADARAAGAEAARALRERLGGDLPGAVMFFAVPGHEEDLLAGVAEVLPGVPAFGGSAADNAISGDWWVFTDEGPLRSAVTLVGFEATIRAGGAMVAPYKVTGHEAEVTDANDRHLRTLDGQPAGEVLDRWLDGALSFQLAEGGNILAQTALRPIGIRRTTDDGEHLVTIHPAQVHAGDHSVDVFARLRSGDRVCHLTGSVDGLLEALDTLARNALKQGNFGPAGPRAGLLIYCAGCSAAVGERLGQGLREHLAPRLPGVALLGACTFGEQGHVPGLGNLHQDLTLSLLLLG